jgi:plasmid stability protein
MLYPEKDRGVIMTVIELPDDKAEVLRARAARHGLTLESWMRQMADEDIDSEIDPSDPHPLQTVANIVLDAMRPVPPEAFANRPKDGASEHDHYLYGHPKRNS